MNLNAWFTLGIGAVQAVATVVLVWITVMYVRLTATMAKAASSEASARRQLGRLDALRSTVSVCVDLQEAVRQLRGQCRGLPVSTIRMFSVTRRIEKLQAEIARRVSELPDTVAIGWHFLSPDVVGLLAGAITIARVSDGLREHEGSFSWRDVGNDYKQVRNVNDPEWDNLSSGAAHDAVVDAVKELQRDAEAEIKEITGV